MDVYSEVSNRRGCGIVGVVGKNIKKLVGGGNWGDWGWKKLKVFSEN